MSGPTTTAVLVDWLGRGGIAQTSEAWLACLRSEGIEVSVATRPGRDLASDLVWEATEGTDRHPLLAHRRLAKKAADHILERRPDTVIVQNYVLPELERPVHEAAHAVGARLIVVVHDHRAHSLLSGNRVGLRRALTAADVVVAHTHFVAEALETRFRRSVEVVDLPALRSILDAPRPSAMLGQDRRPTAIHFGVLKRRYKGGSVAVELAGSTPGWRFAFVGTGAPTVEGAVTLPGYVPDGDLARAVEEADVALLPYRFATQSGAVALAQAVGTVAVASAVGGIPEQIADGSSGRLVPAGAGVSAWRTVLAELADPEIRAGLIEGGRKQAAAAQERFETAVAGIVA